MEKNDSKKYQGYLWMSDERLPRLLNDQVFEFTCHDYEEPFIVEGRLWCPDNKTSVSITCVDGKYIVDSVSLDQQPPETMTDESYLPNKRLAAALENQGLGGSQLAFKRLWQHRPDPLCENLEVLEPGKLVFVGFKKKEA